MISSKTTDQQTGNMENNNFPGINPNDSLCDNELSPDVKEYSSMITRSFKKSIIDRSVSLYLVLDSFQNIEESYNCLKAKLMMECLSDFVHSQNGQIVLEVNFNGDKTIEPTYHKIAINGGYRKFLWEGTVFIWFPDEKVVLSAIEDSIEESLDISVRSNKSSGEFFRRWEKYTRQNNYLFAKAFFADGSIIERTKTYTWNDIILPDDIKHTIKLNIESFLSHRDKLRRLGAKGRRGLILSGPPGTGKTLVGKVLSETLDNVSFMWVSPRHIENPRSFDSILSLARFVSPTVLFLEDIDLYAENRHSNAWMGLGELMNQLDGANDNQNIVAIATTNRLEVVENAIRNRPGRFDRVIEFGTMDELCRQNFIKKLLYKAKISPDNIHYLITKTEDFTGAQVEELVNTIFMIALDNDKSNSQINHEGDKLAIDHKIIETAFEETKFAPKGWGFGINVA